MPQNYQLIHAVEKRVSQVQESYNILFLFWGVYFHHYFILPSKTVTLGLRGLEKKTNQKVLEKFTRFLL